MVLQDRMDSFTKKPLRIKAYLNGCFREGLWLINDLVFIVGKLALRNIHLIALVSS